MVMVTVSPCTILLCPTPDGAVKLAARTDTAFVKRVRRTAEEDMVPKARPPAVNRMPELRTMISAIPDLCQLR